MIPTELHAPFMATHPSPAIRFRGIAKTYADGFGARAQEALRGVDLIVPRRIIFGLIGPNGAGKTTLIKTLLSVVRPTSGSVEVLGCDPEDPSVRARIGYLPERLHLPDAWTPHAFLCSVGRLKGLHQPGDDALRQLSRMGLSQEAQRVMRGFSKGMRQRVGLAAALLGSPELLVLDEPSDGVDPMGRVEIRKILVQEKERGATVLLNSHLLSETERVCDRVGILISGKVTRQGTLEALCGSGTRWRIGFAPGHDADALARIGFTQGDFPGAWHCEAGSPAALNELLDRARASGALMVELQKDLRELEDVLAEAMGVTT